VQEASGSMPADGLCERSGWPLPGRCGTLIVGAGLAGLELARELSAGGGGDILVLEAGPGTDLRHCHVANTADDAQRMWLRPDTDPYFRRPWRSARPPYFEAGSGLRQRLGGRSLYWYGVVLPIERWAMADGWWPTAVARDLHDGWRGQGPLYERVTGHLAAWRGGGAPPPHEARAEVDLAGLAFAPTPRAVRHLAADPSRWHAYSPLDAWRDPVSGEVLLRPEGVRLHAGVAVERIESKGRDAHSVTARQPDGERVTVRAERVVLAAGTVASSQLALQALADAGAGITRLGGLADHIVQGFFLRLGRAAAERLRPRYPPGSYWAPAGAGTRSNLFLEVEPGRDGQILVDLRVTGEQLPSQESFVTCEAGGEPPWPTVVQAALSAADTELITRQRQLLQASWCDLAAAAGCASSRLDFGEYASPARGNAFVLPETIRAMAPGVPATWSSFLGTEDHEGGTLPLGTVLSDEQEFRAVPGLYAAGPSTFPRLGAANPSLTTLALSHRLAALLLDRC
jgi:choline dehydrogenase-like flavoprotein